MASDTDVSWSQNFDPRFWHGAQHTLVNLKVKQVGFHQDQQRQKKKDSSQPGWQKTRHVT
jgi:hypothetical protein